MPDPMTPASRPKLKYLVMGGSVLSKTDGDMHHVSAQQLVRLYGLNLMECVLCDADQPEYRLTHRNLIELGPRYDGNYQPPEASA